MPTMMKTSFADLSDRELSVLQGIAQDKTYAEIAYDLGLSFETIKVYANRLRAKLGISSKIGLAIYATEQRLCRRRKTTEVG